MNSRSFLPLAPLVLTTFLATASTHAEQASKITHNGITWTFDQPRTIGRFVTGDYWVVGPVTIIGTIPISGPDTAPAPANAVVKSRYGAVSMQDDARLRNGSMIVLQAGPTQGYDSRLKSYQPELSATFPLTLPVNRSLISTISHTEFPVAVLHADIMWTDEKKSSLALRSAAILTCLATPPPPDAFRPPYTGTAKPLHTLSEIRWDLLPNLPAASPTPSFERYARYLERPWLDHLSNWTLQNLGPSENQVNYGREFCRITATASLLLMTDAPREQKQKLAIGLVQLGIDLAGLAENGRVWTPDGGHWNGRKWPLLFAGILLDDQRMKTLAASGIFSEDRQTYYGTGWAGQTVLYQIGSHTGVKPPYENKAPDTWNAGDKLSEGYRITVSGGWPGIALAAQLMKAKPLWNHDAFFDYCDRWMQPDDAYAARRGTFPRAKQEGRTLDPFIDAMWKSYRTRVPSQASGKDNLQWVWNEDRKTGRFIPNDKP